MNKEKIYIHDYNEGTKLQLVVKDRKKMARESNKNHRLANLGPLSRNIIRLI